ncbi:MAG: anti-sigma factor [Actinobacteria bacterium]|nr:anti-sigma factor [Actinomycetota bacterium]
MSDERPGHGPGGESRRERFDDLKGAYVLGALDESERREFEGYLTAHPELQAEVDELGSVADLLALAPQEYEPSPELRRNLLGRIGDASDAPPQRRARSRGRIFGPGGLAAAAVAVLAIVGLSLWNASLLDENEDLRGSLETRETHELQGSGPAEEVRGEVVEVRDGRAVLVAENLPPTPEGEVYETWLMRGGVPEPAGLFQPRGGGDAAAPIEGSIDEAEAVAVTVEPSGGSPAPTSDILLTTTL